jgi:transcriptional regulator with XRE-family HTH domain
MKIKQREFEVLIPKVDGSGTAEKIKVMVPVRWDEEVQAWLMTPEAHEIIDNTKARHLGLLLPAQLKELRDRYGYTQKEMGELFQLGEKSWTRWESGEHRPSRSINLLIRALYEGEISINYLLQRAGKPAREEAEPVLRALQAFSKASKSPWPALTDTIVQYFAAAVQPVQVQCTAAQGKDAFVAQLLKLVEDNPGPAEPPSSEAVPTLRHRRGMPPPTHIYPQPRLTTPTVA